MQVNMTFELTDERDQYEFDCAVNATKMAGFIWEFSQYLRSEEKYSDEPDNIEKIRENFWELLNEADIPNCCIN